MAEKRNVRAIRDWIQDPENTLFWDDDLIQEYRDVSPEFQNDSDMVDNRGFREAMMTRAYREGLRPEEYERVIPAYRKLLQEHVQQGMPKDEYRNEMQEMEKSVQNAIKLQYPQMYRQNVERNLNELVNVQRETGNQDILQDIARMRVELAELKRQEEATPQSFGPRGETMRYSGYDVIGKTKRGNKIIRLR